MNIKPTIFRSYDIRGVFPSEINENVAFRVGQAFAELIQKETKKKKIKLAVSRDLRHSSSDLAKSIIAGMIDQGADVFDLGLNATPTFYFAVGKYKYDGGIQVTASHLRKEFNGFKMVRNNSKPVSAKTGILKMRDRILKNKFKPAKLKGKIYKKENILSEQIKFDLKQADLKKIKPFKIVIDAANAMGGPMFDALFKYLPCKIVKLNFQQNENFPSHEPDPLKDENNRQLQKKVLAEKADLGIALDADADRIFFVDDKGKTVEPAIIRGILAQIFLKGHKGAKVCYDIRPGQITIDMIKAAGGKPVVTPVGHSLIKDKAIKVNAVFAGESSGHFFVKTPFGIFEEPIICLLKILQELTAADSISGHAIRLSEYIKPLQKYFHSGEINFNVKDKEAVFKKLKQKFGRNLKYDFDGLSFEFSDYWFNVRASNTESKMRLNLEARTREAMEKNVKIVSALIK